MGTGVQANVANRIPNGPECYQVRATFTVGSLWQGWRKPIASTEHNEPQPMLRSAEVCRIQKPKGHLVVKTLNVVEDLPNR